MSFADKARNKAEQMKGTVKERIGDATDNERMQAEGAKERTTAKAKQAGEHVKEAGRDASDAFRR
ncbi:CsbD family protein [Phytohabitans kaempferiae]|uniref:CsbD family protein n=1 Tax=Phytohabitans kaempferiae TaxID=1620943 RepID=A0ABV6MBP9_9ACTN